ncbi:MAG: hypothetical protein HYX75_18620 [Acidobacteria bacterium]|nr:hypothetical protein [Acidobacteriota bacterium]
MARGKRAWLFAALAFIFCLLPAFFAGITFIGHARPMPYVSVGIDRLVLVAVSLGLPALVAFTLYRFLDAKKDDTEEMVAAAMERAFHGKWREARTILGRYGSEAREREPERVRLAAIELSGGDLSELSRLVELAKQDRRTILMWAKQRYRAAERS